MQKIESRWIFRLFVTCWLWTNQCLGTHPLHWYFPRVAPSKNPSMRPPLSQHNSHHQHFLLARWQVGHASPTWNSSISSQSVFQTWRMAWDRHSEGKHQTQTCHVFLPILKEDSSIYKKIFQLSTVRFWFFRANARCFAWFMSLMKGFFAAIWLFM